MHQLYDQCGVPLISCHPFSHRQSLPLSHTPWFTSSLFFLSAFAAQVFTCSSSQSIFIPRLTSVSFYCFCFGSGEGRCPRQYLHFHTCSKCCHLSAKPTQMWARTIVNLHTCRRGECKNPKSCTEDNEAKKLWFCSKTSYFCFPSFMQTYDFPSCLSCCQQPAGCADGSVFSIRSTLRPICRSCVFPPAVQELVCLPKAESTLPRRGKGKDTVSPSK